MANQNQQQEMLRINHESEKIVQPPKKFHTEVPDYWNQRKLIMEILKYLSSAAHPHMPHWTKDADAAQRLAGAVENDHGGRI